MLGGRTRGRAIKPIPFTGDNDLLFDHLNVQFTNTIHLLGGNNLFTVKIAEEELEALKDSQDNIRYAKVFEWLLPQYGDDDIQTFWGFLAARMRNYMLHTMRTKGFKPKYYDPVPIDVSDNSVIEADHVTRFFGCNMARMLRGFPSINETWSTRESLDAIGAVKDCMPQDAYKDIH